MNYAVVEGLLKGLDVKDDSTEMEQINQICGFDKGKPSRELPVENFLALLDWLAEHFFPHLTHSEGLFQVGFNLFDGYKATILGRVQLAAIGVMGPDRLVKKYPEMADKNSNFGQRSVQQLDTHKYLISYRGVPLPPEYLIGLFHSGLKATGVEKLSVKCKQLGSEDTDFEISW